MVWGLGPPCSESLVFGSLGSRHGSSPSEDSGTLLDDPLEQDIGSLWMESWDVGS